MSGSKKNFKYIAIIIVLFGVFFVVRTPQAEPQQMKTHPSCPKLDQIVMSILTEPNQSGRLAVSQVIHRRLNCGPLPRTCGRFLAGFETALRDPSSFPEHKILNIMALHQGFGCDAEALIPVLEEISKQETMVIPPSSSNSGKGAQ